MADMRAQPLETQWEYQIETVDSNNPVRARFNELGRLGWELVAIAIDPAINLNRSHDTFAFFKRPLGHTHAAEPVR